MAKVARWLCRFGWHAWESLGNRRRGCTRCPRIEQLEFYSNRTHEWVPEE